MGVVEDMEYIAEKIARIQSVIRANLVKIQHIYDVRNDNILDVAKVTTYVGNVKTKVDAVITALGL